MIIEKDKIIEAKAKLGEKAAILIAKDLDIKNWNPDKLKGSCIFHDGDENPSFIWSNKNNSFHCFGCGANYDILNHYMKFYNLTYIDACERLFKETNIKCKLSEKNVHTQKREYRYPHEEKFDRTKVEEYLALRNISKKTLDYCGIGSDKYGNIAFHYYDTNDVLVTVKYRPSHKIVSKKENKEWCQKDADTTPALFNMNKIDITQPLLITEGECFRGDVEVLGENGWIRLDQYNNQNILQINQDLSGTFVTPNAYVKKPYSGDLYCFHKGGNYASITTPNHNIVYVNKKGEIRKRHACDMPNAIEGYIPTVTYVNGLGSGLSKAQIALYIAVSADGTIDKRIHVNDYIRIYFKKQRKIERFEKILKLNSIAYCKTQCNNGYTFYGFNAPDWLISKEFPSEWISSFTYEERKFFIEEMVNWDGNHVTNRQQYEYASVNKHNIKFIQTIAHTCGYMSTIMKRKSKLGEWYKCSILLNKHSISWQDMHNHFKTEPYSGFVYCVSVDSGMILVRQEGKISISGNCDCLSAIESGFTNAVSVPFGANNFSWIEQNFDWLEQFDKIIIWSDNDNPGVAMRKEIISRLGDWRCYYIDLPKEIDGNEVKDANEVLYYFGKEKIIDIINNAQEVPIKGVVDAYDVENYDLENSEGIYTGIKELDKKIYKIVAGTVNIITGSTGAGKSVLVNQCFIAEPLNQGYDTYVFSGELPNSQEVSWIHLVLSGRDHITMANEKVHKIDKDTRQQVREWCKGRLFLHKDTNLDNRDSTILDEMEMMCRRRGVKNFVIDNMMMIDFDCDEKEVLRKQKEFMLKLLSFAKRHNAFVTLVIHPHKLDFPRRLTVGDISGSGNVTNLAHYVFSLYKYTESDKEGSKNKRGEYYKGKEPKNHDVVLDVLKNRITGFTGTGCELNFDYQSYRFYNTTDELWKRYGWNKDTSPLPTTDPKDFFNQGENK